MGHTYQRRSPQMAIGNQALARPVCFRQVCFMTNQESPISYLFLLGYFLQILYRQLHALYGTSVVFVFACSPAEGDPLGRICPPVRRSSEDCGCCREGTPCMRNAKPSCQRLTRTANHCDLPQGPLGQVGRKRKCKLQRRASVLGVLGKALQTPKPKP